MNRSENDTRLPHSLRKHIRRQKANLRRTLPPAEARLAIAQLMRRYGQGRGPHAAKAPRSGPGSGSSQV